MAAPQGLARRRPGRLRVVRASTLADPGRARRRAGELFAAQVQFDLSRQLRRLLKARGTSAEELSDHLHKARDHVGRKLRGEEWIQLRDVGEWASMLDAPERIEWLLPPRS